MESYVARLQIEISEDTLAKYKEVARLSGTSVAALTRKLIDAAIWGAEDRRVRGHTREYTDGRLEHISVQEIPGAPGWLASPVAKEALASARLDGETQSVTVEEDDGALDDVFGIAARNLADAKVQREREEMAAEIARAHARPAPKPVAAKRRTRG
jgi:hypothetical protein